MRICSTLKGSLLSGRGCDHTCVVAVEAVSAIRRKEAQTIRPRIFLADEKVLASVIGSLEKAIRPVLLTALLHESP